MLITARYNNTFHDSSMLPLIFNCILFSFLAALIFILVSQPEDSQLLFQEHIAPHIQLVRKTIRNAFRPRPTIYDLTHHIPSYTCFNESIHNQNLTEDKCQKVPILSDEIRQAYERDGVVAIRGLLSPKLISDLKLASDVLIARERDRLKQKGHEFSSGKQFQTKKMGPLFDLGEGLTGFRNVAFTSILPQIVAELLDLDLVSNITNVRILRDVFLAKDQGQYVCGWHGV